MGEDIQRHVHQHVTENPDSLEISTPSRGGAIKVYHNADDPEGFKKKVLAMLDVRQEVQLELAKRGQQ
jgi:hypothetical protein